MNIIKRRANFYVVDAEGVTIRKFRNEKDAKDFIGVEEEEVVVVKEVKASGVPYSVRLSDIKLPNKFK